MRNRLFASLFVVIALLFGITNSASADQWDYIYGEDPTNANNVSSFQDVLADPLGGIYLTGYFFGSYEGLVSGGEYNYFVQHRNTSGQVDWTVPFQTLSISETPSKNFRTYVDGAGNLFIQQFISSNSTWHSFTRSGAHQSTTENISVRKCLQAVGADEGGLIRLCVNLPNSSGVAKAPGVVEKVDINFSQSWLTDLSPYASSICNLDFISRGFSSTYNSDPGCEYLIDGAESSFWLVDGLNESNFSFDQDTLPQVARTATAMTRFSSTDGTKAVAIKHYGVLPRAVSSIGDRSLWMLLDTKDPSLCNSRGRNDCTQGRGPIAVFNASNGSLVGTIDKQFGFFNSFPYYVQSGGSLNEPFRWLFDQGITAVDMNVTPNAPYHPDYCLTYPFQPAIDPSWLPAGETSFSNMNYGCGYTNSRWFAHIAQDGRQLVLVIGDKLIIFRITEDESGIPSVKPDSLISVRRFSSSIAALASDQLGNIYVAGSTTSSTIFAQQTNSRSPQGTYSSARAFLARNPTGRIGLTVLPRTPLRIKVAGTNGVPATGVGAVSMNVTVTSPDGEGFITVYPCDTKPDASNLNYTLDQTVPNAVIAPVSSTGEVCFYTNAETHLLADINGYFPTGQGFTAAGPTRVFDTRSGSAQGLRTVNKVKIGGDQEVRVKMTGLAGLTPSTGVGAVSLNITATGTTADDFGGYVTVYPCGDRPNASSLNFVSGQTVPNAVIAPVSASGEVCFYALGTTDLIVDLNGHFLSGAGFTPTTPTRIADTRSGSDQGVRTVTKAKVGGDTTLKVQFTDIAGLTPSSGVGAVSLNVTATGTTADDFGGYVTVYPCGALPNASNLNFVSGQIVPNAVIAPVSASGEVCFYARGTTDLIVDLNGYFLSGAGFAPMSPVRLFDTR
jgi:hypothetical protein